LNGINGLAIASHVMADGGGHGGRQTLIRIDGLIQWFILVI
jgi:hypothetical protein